MGAQYVGRWEGGEVLRLKDGTRTYVLSRTIRGRRFRFSTRAKTLPEARAVQLKASRKPRRRQSTTQSGPLRSRCAA